MINRILIQSLFGIFDYDIQLKSDGVTILTGPNGYGKSTILMAMESLYEGDILFFIKLDFKNIIFYSSSGQKMVIRKTKDKMYINDYSTDILKLSQQINNMALQNQYINYIVDTKWADFNLDSASVYKDIMNIKIDENISYQIDQKKVRSSAQLQYHEIKQQMADIAGNTRFIKEQRLLIEKNNDKIDRNKSKTIVHTIDDLPIRFKDIMNTVSSTYSSVANQLDSSYPKRLFSTTVGISSVEYTRKLETMNDKFKKLNKYNISDMTNLKNVNFLEEHAKALKVYFEDFDNKYDVYKEFVYQLELFTEIVNKRLKFKELRISREAGITVHKLTDGSLLHLNQLSSGEKQEIVLFYELIFETDENVHLLIDEPEISLHIAWQTKFMDDLLKIAEYKNLKVTLATHSPHIINDHWDIQVDLGEMYGN